MQLLLHLPAALAEQLHLWRLMHSLLLQVPAVTRCFSPVLVLPEPSASSQLVIMHQHTYTTYGDTAAGSPMDNRQKGRATVPYVLKRILHY